MEVRQLHGHRHHSNRGVALFRAGNVGRVREQLVGVAPAPVDVIPLTVNQRTLLLWIAFWAAGLFVVVICLRPTALGWLGMAAAALVILKLFDMAWGS